MSQPRILVIDDDPLFRSLLVSVLKGDYVVEAFKDGAEGFYHAAENPPDAAIIDVNMPGWDGLRTLRAFREHHLTADCPVMMLTGDPSRETVVRSINSGADEYVVKSAFCRREFVAKLATMLNARLGVDATAESRLTGLLTTDDTAENDLQVALDNWE